MRQIGSDMMKGRLVATHNTATANHKESHVRHRCYQFLDKCECECFEGESVLTMALIRRRAELENQHHHRPMRIIGSVQKGTGWTPISKAAHWNQNRIIAEVHAGTTNPVRIKKHFASNANFWGGATTQLTEANSEDTDGTGTVNAEITEEYTKGKLMPV